MLGGCLSGARRERDVGPLPAPALSCAGSRRTQQLCPWLFLDGAACYHRAGTPEGIVPFFWMLQMPPWLGWGSCSQAANFPQRLNEHLACLSPSGHFSH